MGCRCADFISFGIDVLIAGENIFCLELNHLADPDAGCRHETDEKIVSVPFIPKQAAFQVFIIRLADHVIQICFLLDFYHGKMPGIELFKIQVGIQSPDPLVDGLRLVVLEQKDFV